jgi:putative thiamine transport system permease protein
LGHSRLSAWFRVLLPQLYPHLRLPLMAVLAFSLSVVDMALILGPNTPPTLAVQILRWFSDPDLSLRLLASAGASLLSLVMLAVLLIWLAAERLIMLGARGFLSWGPARPSQLAEILERLSAAPTWCALALGLAALVPLLVWSLARRWRFPDAWPARWSLARWHGQAEALGNAWGNTLILASLATGLALVLVVLSLEKEARYGRRLSGQGTQLLKYLPLLVPQTSFLFGFQVLALAAGISDGQTGRWALVVWSHLLYVLPYGFISLSLAYQRFDPRLVQTAQSLGRGPWQIFWSVKLPLLSPAIWAAAAIGVAASVTQYLPTVLLSGGRIETLATETVGRSAGGDRRVLAVFALCQAALPFAALLLAGVAPRLMFWNRKGVWS